METNGNGVLDHLTSSPVSVPSISQHGPDTSLPALYRAFQQLQAQRMESELLFEQILTHSYNTEEHLRRENEDLRTRLKESHLDFTDATKSRRELQQRVEDLNHQMGFMSSTNEYLKNYNPYVVILIDGDGCHFQKRFIEQGVEGGKQAAYALRKAILHESPAGHGSGVEVTARFIANLAGLAYITRASGTVENEGTVRQFTSGFTQAMASFDFIDVGSGKERADTKIKEAIRWHLKNHNCKQIVVGISFDSGYASFLDDVLVDEESRRRITILEGPPSHRDLVAHRLHTVNLNGDVLRADKLEALAYQTPIYVDRRLSNVTPMTITPPATIAGMLPLPPPPAAPSNAGPQADSDGHQIPAAQSSYATAIKTASPPPQINLPIPLKNKVVKAPVKSTNKTPLWNPGARGLDAPLEVHQPSLDNIKKRKDHKKLCNNHYLRGPCAKGDLCCFEHNYRASEQEKIAISFLARQNPCTSGQDCDVEDCIYGHHCPSTISGQCTHSYCKFKPWEHPPNTKFRPTYQYLDEE
ncbi:unnamed protein product [Discula destructiva]